MSNLFELQNFVLVTSIGLISFICLIIIFLIAISMHIMSKKESKLFLIIKYILIPSCFVCIYLSLPYFILALAMQQEMPTSLNSLKFAANIAVIPSVKSELYYEMSIRYGLLNEGANAIKTYEEAVKITGKTKNIHQDLICPMYFWKDDIENVHKTCSPNLIAAFYLKNNDFNTALKTSNDYISTLQVTDKRRLCFARAIRAAINKKKGDKSAFDADANFVKQECPDNTFAIKCVEANDLFDVFMPHGKNLKF